MLSTSPMGEAFARLAAEIAQQAGASTCWSIRRHDHPADHRGDADRRLGPVLAVNLRGPFNGTQAVIPHMKRRGGGAIVNIASSRGAASRLAAGANYSASKAGLLGFTRHAAYELAPDKIRVNAVCPGTDRDRLRRRPSAVGRAQSERAKKIPLGRMVEAETSPTRCCFSPAIWHACAPVLPSMSMAAC